MGAVGRQEMLVLQETHRRAAAVAACPVDYQRDACMSFAEALGDAEMRVGGKSVMPRILESMDPDDRAALEEAAANPDIPTAQIERALKAIGVSVSQGTLRAWRTSQTS